ncbi:50S ribosomal protein L17 [Mariniphaga sediminis]|uniref:Large ribosomal subunit protein bL17 n=1 Tax=Mariniphaga sediminis TaxID=1628158 RepID=A0A399D0F7_9BACT|nr:50S ribosomal protein L17 [Mariniphaga sediminis]
MRHNKKFNHLGRTSSHRKAMLANMASSLIESKRISTTLAKAKALRTYVEPLITKAKDDTTHSRRVVFSHLQNKNAVSELFRDVAVKVADRPGGYTRILRTGNRLGDNAEMCIIELVDYNEAMLTSTEEAAKPKRRRSRRGGKKEEAPAAEAAKQAKPVAEKESATAEAEEVKAVEDVQPVEETEEKAEAEVKSEASAEAEAEEKPADEASEEDKKKEE